VIDGLEELHLHLLEHLECEERNAGPTMRRLDHLASDNLFGLPSSALARSGEMSCAW
jgi:hypothetical protein